MANNKVDTSRKIEAVEKDFSKLPLSLPYLKKVVSILKERKTINMAE